jgi:hypothetical protein
VGARSGLDRRGKSRPTGIRSPHHPALSESLYRLSYLGPILLLLLLLMPFIEPALSGYTIILEIWEPPPLFRGQECDIKPVPHYEPIFLKSLLTDPHC